MWDVTEISFAKNDFPIELRHLRVAAYCRVIVTTVEKR